MIEDKLLLLEPDVKYVHYVTASAVGQTIEYLVPERDRITIRNNYLLGW